MDKEDYIREKALDWDGWDETSSEAEWSFTRQDLVNAYIDGYKQCQIDNNLRNKENNEIG